MTASRKLAAILTADVVGYSRLMGEDEAGTAQAVREGHAAAEAIAAARGGRVFKTMGDGIFIEFPSVVSAVECALAVQRMMAERSQGVPDQRRLVYRIGVSLGDVLVEGEDLVGDGVNIAARLEGIAEPGGVCVSGSAYEHVRGRVEAEFVDLGEKALKNIARPVRVFAVKTGAVVAPRTPIAPAPETHGPPRLSIVVLPFANIGGDPEQDYFVDGVTESLTTDLSRMSGMLVIGRNTAFTYKDKAVNLKTIGRELNVRYVLEGSVQRGGNRMRVNVQLIDAESGTHLWADRFEKPVADLFDMQDEIVARLANALNAQLVAAEARRAEKTPHPDSIDLLFQGVACANRGTTLEVLQQARGYFERALTLDPDNLDALLQMAIADATIGVNIDPADRTARLGAAEAALTRALFAAPENAFAHLFMGAVLTWTNRATQGIAEFERALALDRNLAAAHGFMGLAKIFIGRPEETEAHVGEALRLSPRDNRAYLWTAIAGYAKLRLGLDEEAVAWLRRSIETNPNLQRSHFWLAVGLAHLGRLAEAAAAVQVGRSLDPKFTIATFRAAASSDDPTYLAQSEQVYVGMRLAGVPDG